MDHLPLPYGAALTEADEVLDVSLNDYESVSFLEYPAKYPAYTVASSMGAAVVLSKEPRDMDPLSLERFLQTWLFFGLIKEFLGPSFKHATFVKKAGRRGNSRQILSTTQLNRLVKAWMKRIQKADPNQRPDDDHLFNCIRITRYALRNTPPGFSPNLMFVLTTVASTFSEAIFTAFEWPGEHGDSFIHDSADNSTVRCLRMAQNGWCPAQASAILGRYENPTFAHYISHLKKSQLVQMHADCATATCVAMQINKSKYNIQHVSPECECKPVLIKTEALTDILQADSIPLLKLSRDPQSKVLSVTVVPQDSANSDYVALSHVWADGLGNPFENELPECQLNRLYNLLQQFQSTNISMSRADAPLLWIDTLCCPAKPSDGKTLAIGRMAQTYQNAAAVLVLESTLSGIDHTPLQPLEIALRVLTSPWMFRLWTLQEAFLASSLFIQFRDGIVDLDGIVSSLHDYYEEPVFENLSRQTRLGLLEIRPESRHQRDTLHNLTEALLLRSVSVRSDEALCVGAYLDLNVDALARMPEDDNVRMREIWNILGKKIELPRDLIFQCCPRLSHPGFGWAPPTLLSVADADYYRMTDAYPIASLTSDGLEFSSLAGSLSVPSCSSGLSDLDNEDYLESAELMMDSAGQWYLIDEIYELTENQVNLYDLVALGATEMTLLQKDDWQDEDRVGSIESLLVDCLGTEEGINHVQGRLIFDAQPRHPDISAIYNKFLHLAKVLQEQHPWSQDLREASTSGGHYSEYVEVYNSIIELLQVSSAGLISRIGEEVIADALIRSAVKASRIDRALYIILKRFYFGRYLILGPVEEQRFCHH